MGKNFEIVPDASVAFLKGNLYATIAEAKSARSMGITSEIAMVRKLVSLMVVTFETLVGRRSDRSTMSNEASKA